MQRGLVASQSHTSITWQGPIPPPEILRQYDGINPGTAERIIRLVEGQAEHRQKLESQVIAADVRHAHLGLWLGCVVSVVALGAAVACAALGATVSAAIIGGGDIVALAGIFVYGSYSRRSEREKRRSPPAD